MHNKENIALESNNRNGDTDGFTHPKFRYSCQKDLQGRETPTLKNSRFSGNFCFYEMELNVSEKFANFHAMLDNFLVTVIIFYCWFWAIVFQFCQKLNAVRSKNSEFSQRILCILLVFGEIIAYACKMIMDLKNINWRKSSYSNN